MYIVHTCMYMHINLARLLLLAAVFMYIYMYIHVCIYVYILLSSFLVPFSLVCNIEL